MNRIVIFVSLFILCACNEEKKSNVPESNVDFVDQRKIENEPLKRAFFGDLHIHTSWSFDAFIYNVRTTPDDAYRFGKGEAIDLGTEYKIQNQRPLDFMAVTDHAEYMGIMKQMIDVNHPFFDVPIAENVRNKDRGVSLKAFGEIGTSIARNTPIKYLMDEEIRKSTWDRIVSIANEHYEPGKFTTFPGYEFTSSPSDSIKKGDITTRFARNLHRNVIYQGENLSKLPYSSFDSQNPEDLWNWMDSERAKGIELMAIPHNGNMSDGQMYSSFKFEGSPMTVEYINQRMRNEPINEVVQVKGQSMSHPILNSNDEFADFELFEYTFSTTIPPASKAPGSYVREAFQRGLEIENSKGVNPFKFGIIGSSDGHNSAGPVEENNYFGKFESRDGTPEKRLNTEERFLRNRVMSAAGLAGVWAEKNTRESIFVALQRKETFATSGPRIRARLFGSSNFDFQIDDPEWLSKAQIQGVPMGSDLSDLKSNPQFLIWAVKDANGANLDRIQLIKAWISKEGKAQEKIYNVAWSDHRTIDYEGKISPVGNTVNVREATYENSIGAVELKTFWEDPNFNSDLSAMYYLRILEIPTPRWSTYDSKNLGINVSESLPSTIQERAWTSPIWYTPKKD